VKCITGNATLAEVKAGKIILPKFSGQYIIVGGWMRALAVNAAGADSINISDTTATPVVGVAIAVGALTAGALVDFDAAANVTRTTYGAAFAAGKGLQILDAGAGALSGCTSVDFCIKYTTVNTA